MCASGSKEELWLSLITRDGLRLALRAGLSGGSSLGQRPATLFFSNVSNVTYMGSMFLLATSFNQDISAWDVSNVTNMHGMFDRATAFNQDLSSWAINNVTDCMNFSYGATTWTEPKPTFTNTNCTE